MSTMLLLYGLLLVGMGDYLIVDRLNHRVQLCPACCPGSDCATVAGGYGTGSGEFNNPLTVELYNDDLLISDHSNNRIQLCPVAAQGSPCTTVGGVEGFGSGTGQLKYPCGATFDGEGNFVFSDSGNDRVQLCSPSSPYSCSTVAGTGGEGSGLQQLNSPYGVAMDEMGNYVIADVYNHRVLRCPGLSPGSDCTVMVAGLNYPHDVHILPSGEYLIADAHSHSVILCPSTPASSCSTVAGGAGAGSGPTQLNKPTSVVIDENSDYVIADYNNHRVQLCPAASPGASCTTVAGTGASGSTATQLSGPWSVVVVSNLSTNTTSTDSTSSSTTTTTNTSSTSTSTNTTSSTSTTTSSTSTSTNTTSSTSTTTSSTSTSTNTTILTSTTTSSTSTSTNTTSLTSTTTSSTSTSTNTTSLTSTTTSSTSTSTNTTSLTSTTTSSTSTSTNTTSLTSMSTTGTSATSMNTSMFSWNRSARDWRTSGRTVTNASNKASPTTARSSTTLKKDSTDTPGRHSSEWAAAAITALLHDGTDRFFQMFSNVSVSDDAMIQELLVVAEGMAWNDSAQVDAETSLRVVTAVGDVVSDGLSEDEVGSYETPGGTVLQVMTPSHARFSMGFVLGPFAIPPLHERQHQNASVQVISWAKNLFDLHNTSSTMRTINFRKERENVELKNLAHPLQFSLHADERITHSATDMFHRICVFWNTTSGNWSDGGLEVARANLTQVWCESTHATSFAVRFVTTCPLCTSVPVNFWEFENKMPVSGWVVVALAVLVCLHCAWLHAEDRKDWIPPRQNQSAYFWPLRPVRRNKSALAVLRRILFNLASGLKQQHAHGA